MYICAILLYNFLIYIQKNMLYVQYMSVLFWNKSNLLEFCTGKNILPVRQRYGQSLCITWLAGT